jgi:adenylate cyclase
MSATKGPATNREIERKFKVRHDGWRADVVGEPIPMRAGYLSRRSEATVRVRFEGDEAVLTIKGKAVDADGRDREEHNFPIPRASAEAMLAGPMLDGGVIEKTRHSVKCGEDLFVVDVFAHPRPGLELAEIELSAADQDFQRPDWLGEEVTGDPAYFNATIAAEA